MGLLTRGDMSFMKGPSNHLEMADIRARAPF
jgi:hypothetical protein